MKCKNCGAEIPDESKFCNVCGVKIEKLNVKFQTNENGNIENKTQKYKVTNSNLDKSKSNANGCACLVIGIIAIIVIFTWMGNTGNSSKSDVKPMVWVDAEDAVKGGLKSPSTADFPGDYESYITSNGDGTYTVSAYVDAENSFGAKIRSNFRCKVSNEDGSGEGSVTDLIIDNN